MSAILGLGCLWGSWLHCRLQSSGVELNPVRRMFLVDSWQGRVISGNKALLASLGLIGWIHSQKHICLCNSSLSKIQPKHVKKVWVISQPGRREETGR